MKKGSLAGGYTSGAVAAMPPERTRAPGTQHSILREGGVKSQFEELCWGCPQTVINAPRVDMEDHPKTPSDVRFSPRSGPLP
ncbi:hypothetical protein GCM10010519_29830 [Streptomyces lactacystinicus]